MWKYLRMICAIIAAAAIAASVFVAIFLGMVPFWATLAGALLFFALSMLFKYLQEESEKAKSSGADSAPTDADRPAQDADKGDANADDADADGANADDADKNGAPRG